TQRPRRRPARSRPASIARARPGETLSRRSASAPARAAAIAWAPLRTSTWTRSPTLARARARATASVSGRSARWLFLMRTASERSRRCGRPPPSTTAAFSRSRSPGSVFRVAQTSRGRRDPRAPSTARRVSVATPLACITKLRIVRSAAKIRRASPRRRSTTVPGRTRLPSRWARTIVRPCARAIARTAAIPERTPVACAITRASAGRGPGSRKCVVRSRDVRSSRRARRASPFKSIVGGLRDGILIPLLPEPRLETLEVHRQVGPKRGEVLTLELGDVAPSARGVPASLGKLGKPKGHVNLLQRMIETPKQSARFEEVGLCELVGTPVHRNLAPDLDRDAQANLVPNPAEDFAGLLNVLDRFLDPSGLAL